MSLIIYAILGYLCGSIPTGVLVGRYKGVDPRTSGSKNIGASNVTRVMGKTAGLVTLLVDVFKGLLPTVIISSTVGDHTGLLVGFLAVIGHCFPIWLKLEGGKGVATAFGVVAAVLPIVALVAALVWFTFLFFTRTPAIGSVVAAGLFILLPQMDERPIEIHLFTFGIALVILMRHTGNLRVLKKRYVKDEPKK